jgi:hypothetical protein
LNLRDGSLGKDAETISIIALRDRKSLRGEPGGHGCVFLRSREIIRSEISARDLLTGLKPRQQLGEILHLQGDIEFDSFAQVLHPEGAHLQHVAVRERAHAVFEQASIERRGVGGKQKQCKQRERKKAVQEAEALRRTLKSSAGLPPRGWSIQYGGAQERHHWGG